MVTSREKILDDRLKDINKAERVRPEDIDSVISNIEYYTFPGTLLTICTLQLRNGFVVTGQAACAHPANFNREVAEQLSYERARGKIWLLEGYLLKERLYQTSQDNLDELVAQITHAVNAAYAEAIDDGLAQTPWSQLGLASRKGIIYGVSLVRQNPELSPSFLHESWLEQKRADGWTYGPVKSEENKTHPNLVPYDELPKAQQVKDALFHAVVKSVCKTFSPIFYQ